MLEELKPLGVILVSDHGVQSRNYSVNMNDFLERAGLIKKAALYKRIKISARQSARQFIPNRFHSKLASKFPSGKSVGRIPGSGIYDSAESLVFAVRYIPGIFINTNRFGGNVKSKDIHYLHELISNLVLKDQALANIGVKVDFSSMDSDMAKNLGKEFIPLTEPLGVFFEDSGDCVSKNKFLEKINDRVPRGSSMLTGIKQRDAIFGFWCSKDLMNFDILIDSCSRLTHTHSATLNIIRQIFKE